MDACLFERHFNSGCALQKPKPNCYKRSWTNADGCTTNSFHKGKSRTKNWISRSRSISNSCFCRCSKKKGRFLKQHTLKYYKISLIVWISHFRHFFVDAKPEKNRGFRDFGERIATIAFAILRVDLLCLARKYPSLK